MFKVSWGQRTKFYDVLEADTVGDTAHSIEGIWLDIQTRVETLHKIQRTEQMLPGQMSQTVWVCKIRLYTKYKLPSVCRSHKKDILRVGGSVAQPMCWVVPG